MIWIIEQIIMTILDYAFLLPNEMKLQTGQRFSKSITIF